MDELRASEPSGCVQRCLYPNEAGKYLPEDIVRKRLDLNLKYCTRRLHIISKGNMSGNFNIY